MKQNSFSFMKPIPKEFGADLLQHKRKAKRPLSTKVPIHLVLRSENKINFVCEQRAVNAIIQKISARYKIKIYREAINFNHIHLALKISSERNYKAWIRVLTAELTRLMKVSLFTKRPYTRILSWGRDWQNVLQYLCLNQLETSGLEKKEGRQFLETIEEYRVRAGRMGFV